eukprot:gene21925-21883_t
MDDIGLHLAQSPRKPTAALGEGLVRAMPAVLSGLSIVGTAAMLWVGGGIIVHGLEHYPFSPVPVGVEAASDAAGAVPAVGPLLGWFTFAGLSAVVGLIIGGVIVGVLHLIPKKKPAAH